MDTLLYDTSIPAISSLQSQLEQQAPLMQLTSVVFDPKYAFLIYSPLAYLLDQRIGRRLILTVVIAEWLNMILKWLLHGERPYWYVHSSGHFDPQQVPIKQFPITCELGPGHPSGHAMVTAAVWYIILDSMLSLYQRLQQDMANSPSPSRAAKLSVWTIYAALLFTVSVSRVFLGCHFPHQCLAGALLGFIVAKWVSSIETRAFHFISASAILLTTAFGTFGLLQSLGFDPSWTIKLATKHCEKREYIHLDTAPFFSVMRYCGFALGCGLGLMLPLRANVMQPIASEPKTAGASQASISTQVAVKQSEHLLSSKYITWLSFKILMALLMARLVDNLGLFVSHSNLSLFYSCAFASYTLFSYAIVNL